MALIGESFFINFNSLFLFLSVPIIFKYCLFIEELNLFFISSLILILLFLLLFILFILFIFLFFGELLELILLIICSLFSFSKIEYILTKLGVIICLWYIFLPISITLFIILLEQLALWGFLNWLLSWFISILFSLLYIEGNWILFTFYI